MLPGRGGAELRLARRPPHPHPHPDPAPTPPALRFLWAGVPLDDCRAKCSRDEACRGVEFPWDPTVWQTCRLQYDHAVQPAEGGWIGSYTSGAGAGAVSSEPKRTCHAENYCWVPVRGAVGWSVGEAPGCCLSMEHQEYDWYLWSVPTLKQCKSWCEAHPKCRGIEFPWDAEAWQTCRLMVDAGESLVSDGHLSSFAAGTGSGEIAAWTKPQCHEGNDCFALSRPSVGWNVLDAPGCCQSIERHEYSWWLWAWVTEQTCRTWCAADAGCRGIEYTSQPGAWRTCRLMFDAGRAPDPAAAPASQPPALASWELGTGAGPMATFPKEQCHVQQTCQILLRAGDAPPSPTDQPWTVQREPEPASSACSVPPLGPCAEDAECCGDVGCVGGRCDVTVPQGVACLEEGAACPDSAQCCSGVCDQAAAACVAVAEKGDPANAPAMTTTSTPAPDAPPPAAVTTTSTPAPDAPPPAVQSPPSTTTSTPPPSTEAPPTVASSTPELRETSSAPASTEATPPVVSSTPELRDTTSTPASTGPPVTDTPELRENSTPADVELKIDGANAGGEVVGAADGPKKKGKMGMGKKGKRPSAAKSVLHVPTSAASPVALMGVAALGAACAVAVAVGHRRFSNQQGGQQFPEEQGLLEAPPLPEADLPPLLPSVDYI